MFEIENVTILPGGGLSGELVIEPPKVMLRYIVSGSIREIEEGEYHRNGIKNIHRMTRNLVEIGGAKGLLTDAEYDVYDRILTGKTGVEIAEDLFIADKTVKFHSTHIYKIFKVKGKSALIALALKSK